MKHKLSMIQLFVLIGWLAGLLVINVPRTYACSCAMPSSASVEMRNSGAVFAGKVVSAERDNLAGGYSQMSVTFEVSDVWKGNVKDTVVVTTGMGGGDCGSDFVVGEEYLVYAYGSGPYSTSSCSRTSVLSAATEDLEELGESTKPEPSSQFNSLNSLPLIIGVCGAVMLVMFAAAFLLYRVLSRPSQL